MIPSKVDFLANVPVDLGKENPREILEMSIADLLNSGILSGRLVDEKIYVLWTFDHSHFTIYETKPLANKNFFRLEKATRQVKKKFGHDVIYLEEIDVHEFVNNLASKWRNADD